jgi:hypothetical protein
MVSEARSDQGGREGAVVARLEDLATGQTWTLHAAREHCQEWNGGLWWRWRINRGSRAAVTLPYPWISKHHGGLQFRDGSWWADDGGSIHTVTVNGEPVRGNPPEVRIQSGDVLGFGETRLRFEAVSVPPASLDPRR